MDKSIEERFWIKVNKADGDGCWEWTASKNQDGYGSFRIADKHVGAHRAAYMFAVGPITNGLFVCHRCDNPQCVNPDHLYAGTHQDNQRDIRLRRTSIKATCRKGHLKQGDNLYEYVDPKGYLHRYCRQCSREYHRERRQAA